MRKFFVWTSASIAMGVAFSSVGVPFAAVAADPLQGGVKHEERMPAMSPQYAPGQKLDPNSFDALTPNNQWFQVPDWFAGTWHGESQTILYLHEYEINRTIQGSYPRKEVSDITYGKQKDKLGHIWSFIKVPSVEKVGTDFGTAYLRALREDVISADSEQVVIKFVYDEIQTNDKLVIKSVKQISSINRYTPVEDGVINIHSSAKTFDEDGDPSIVQESEKMLKRTDAFKSKDKDGDLNLKQLFVEYLKSSGHEDLVPG